MEVVSSPLMPLEVARSIESLKVASPLMPLQKLRAQIITKQGEVRYSFNILIAILNSEET